MKNILIIIFALIGLLANAQNEVLLDNFWYLQKIIVDDIEYETPINEEISEVVLLFGETYFMTSVCNAFSGSLEFDNSADSFSIFDVSVTLVDCNLLENFQFEQLYFWQFFYIENDPAQPFAFSLSEYEDYLELSITNSEGVVAVYHNQNTVSLNELKELSLSVYPNPASDFIRIDLPQIKENANIQILDIFGRLITEESLHKAQSEFIWKLDPISPGIYFYQIEIDENRYSGRFMVK